MFYSSSYTKVEGEETVSHSFKHLKTTSAQLSILIALFCYGAIHGQLDTSNIDSENKLEEFVSNFENILQALCSETEARVGLFSGKLSYFDANDKIKLSKRGREELDTLINALKSKGTLKKKDAHHANEFSPPKTAPVSSRRIAILSSLLNSLGILAGYEIIFDEDALFLSAEKNSDTIDLIEDSSSVLLATLFSIMIVLNSLKHDKEKRTRKISEQFRKTCINAILQIKENKIFDEEKIKNTVKNINNQFNVQILKGVQSSVSAKNRSYYTVGLGLAFGAITVIASVALLLADVSTLSISFWIRLGVAIAATAAVAEIRYRRKKIHNERKLYAKTHRPELNKLVQEELCAYLEACGGLQPADKADIVTGTTVNIKRQVEVDVEDFLNSIKMEVKEAKNQKQKLLFITNEDQVSRFSLSLGKDKILQYLEEYIRAYIPEKYRLNNQYFVEEFLFQMRIKFLGEKEEIIAGEREQSICIPAIEFIAKADDVSIQKINQSILIYKAQKSKEETSDPETLSKADCEIVLPDELEILARMYSDASWSSCASPIDSSTEGLKRQIKNKLSYSVFYYIYAAMEFRIMPWQKNDAVLNAYYVRQHKNTLHKLVIKKTSRAHSSFHHSSATLFKQFILSDLPSEEKTKTAEPPVHESSSMGSLSSGNETLLLPKTTLEIGKKTLAQQHEDNMQGVRAASLLSSIPSGLAILYPILQFTGTFDANIGVKCATYSIGSVLSKYFAIHHRRSVKHAARCRLPEKPALVALEQSMIHP